MIFQTTLHTMLVFFLILAVGFLAGKIGLTKQDFLPELAKLVTKVLLPVMIFSSTVAGCTRQTLVENLPMTVVPMIASQRGGEGDNAASLTVTTLVLCVVTLPLVAYLVL